MTTKRIIINLLIFLLTYISFISSGSESKSIINLRDLTNLTNSTNNISISNNSGNFTDEITFQIACSETIYNNQTDCFNIKYPNWYCCAANAWVTNNIVNRTIKGCRPKEKSIINELDISFGGIKNMWQGRSIFVCSSFVYKVKFIVLLYLFLLY